MVTYDDILRGIGSLIENGIKVQCVARDWKLIPQSTVCSTGLEANSKESSGGSK